MSEGRTSHGKGQAEKYTGAEGENAGGATCAGNSKAAKTTLDGGGSGGLGGRLSAQRRCNLHMGGLAGR
jgi:hypothetical protein